MSKKTGKHLFKPGVSGNPAGRPTGSRNKFSEAFCHDLAEKWQRCGGEIIDRVAAEDPARFFAVAASLVPKEVAHSLSTPAPGGLTPDDWALAIEVFRAIKDALPNATDRQPGEVLSFVSNAIRAANAPLIEVEPLDEVTKPEIE